MPCVGISGIRELEAGLGDLGRDAAKALPAVVARKLASLAVMAFRDPDLRPAPWPPLAASTLARAGAASDKASKARDRAAKFRREAYVQDYATAWLDGKAREKARRKSEAAAKKAKEWRGKARAAKAAGASGRAILVRTGNMRQSILAVGEKVVVSAKGGKKGKEYPYPLVHQYGTLDGRVPARPFIPVTDDGGFPPRAEREIRAGLERELATMLRRMGR